MYYPSNLSQLPLVTELPPNKNGSISRGGSVSEIVSHEGREGTRTKTIETEGLRDTSCPSWFMHFAGRIVKLRIPCEPDDSVKAGGHLLIGLWPTGKTSRNTLPAAQRSCFLVAGVLESRRPLLDALSRDSRQVRNFRVTCCMYAAASAAFEISL